MPKIAIIGAGLSGLVLSNLLKAHADILVFEKSKGVGGRLATRRADPYAFDHGAQYFTIKNSQFQQFIHPLIGEGCVEVWKPQFAEVLDDRIVRTYQWSDSIRRWIRCFWSW